MGQTVIIRGPRQTGKSSLLNRLATLSIEREKKVVLVDLQLFDAATRSDAKRFFPQFSKAVVEALDLPAPSEDPSQSADDCIMSCTASFEKHVLKATDGPIMLAIDEADRVFGSPFQLDFFGMLRGWHNRRAHPHRKSLWMRLDLVIVSATEPYMFIDAYDQSPFNVGEILRLEDFSRDQVAELMEKHPGIGTVSAADRLHELFGGQPYLTRRALYEMAQNPEHTTADSIFMQAIADEGPLRDHMRHHCLGLQRHPTLTDALYDIAHGKGCSEDRVFFSLEGAGLVSAKTANLFHGAFCMENTSASISAARVRPTYVAGGTVQASNGIYLERAADHQLLDLCRAGAFAYILTSRQIGKSSLMVRTAERLLDEGFASVILDLTELGKLVSAEQWYGGIIEGVAEQLNLPLAAEWWRQEQAMSIAKRFTRFFRDRVLPALPDKRIVLFLDEIDSTLGLPFTDDLFAAIRFLYHQRVSEPELNRISFVLIGVASPDELIKDPNRTPFNIGTRVELTDFTPAEALPLVQELKIERVEAGLLLGWVLDWTGGHPYLTLWIFRKIQQDGLPWSPNDAVVQQLFFGSEDSPDSNLEFVGKLLLRDDPIRAGVLSTYQAICRGQGVKDDGSSIVKTRLKLSGVVARREGLLRVRNRIYEIVFSEGWLTKAREELQRRLNETSPMLQLEPEKPDEPPLPRRPDGKDVRTTRRQALQSAHHAARVRSSKNRIECSTLLAVESMLESPTFEANQCLHEDLPLLRRLLFRIPHRQTVVSAAISADGQYVATASADNLARIWEVATRRELACLEHRDRVSAVTFSADSQLVATASSDGSARIWLIRSGKLLGELAHEDRVTAALFSRDSRRLATAGQDNVARVWDISRIREMQVRGECVLEHDDHVVALAFSPDGERIGTASWDNSVKLWDTRSGRQLSKVMHTGRLTSVAFDPSASTFATASEDRTACVWEASTGRRVMILPHGGRVTAVRIRDDGQIAATAAEDGARTWSLASGKELMRFEHDGRVVAVAIRTWRSVCDCQRGWNRQAMAGTNRP
jgi:hypothetical protein